MHHFFSLTPAELEDVCADIGLPRFTAQQVMEWVYRHGVVDPSAMTNLSKVGRTRLAEHVVFERGQLLTDQMASDGTHKMLLAWRPIDEDKSALPQRDPGGLPQTECVMIPSAERRTACISSQVGCPVGCTFCASGIGGLEGNLSTGQIVEQVHRLTRADGQRISNIVFMGMGEPLANMSAVLQAIRFLHADWGFGIGARKITVSTVGLPSAIQKLVDFEIPVTLALSLHAPNDELRREMIPWAEYAPIAELLAACSAYFERTGREITLEYILIRNVNDRPQHAHELVKVARTLRSNVNLIRYNEVKSLPYDRPTSEDVFAFQSILRDGGVNAHIRASRGRDIAAACGQLRHERRTNQEADGT